MGRHFTLVLVLAAAGCTEVPDGDECTTCVPRPASSLFLSDRGNDSILRYDGRSGDFEAVFAAGSTQLIDRPASLRLGPSGYAYLAGFGRGDVIRYDVASSDVKDVFYQDTTMLEEPVELAFRGDEVLVLGNDSSNVVVLDADGAPLRELRTATNAHDMVLASDERTLYVGGETEQTAITVFDVETGERRGAFGTAAELASATSLALAPDGTLVACDWQRDQVVRFDPTTGAILESIVAQGSGTLRTPVALDFGPDGALYVLDEDGLHRLDPRTGFELQLLVAARDGYNVRPRAFTFLTETAIAAAIARTR